MNQAPVSIDYPITLNFAMFGWSQSVGVEMKWERVTQKIMSMQNLKILIIICKISLVSVCNRKAAADR
jgi:hypothetical protein